MTDTKAGGLLVPKRSFVVFDGGTRHGFTQERTVIREGHPLLKGREQLFMPLRVHYEIETAPAPAEVAAAPAPAGLALHQALVARAKELGIPATGKNADLEAAIAAAEAEAAEKAAAEAAAAAAAAEPDQPNGDSGSADGQTDPNASTEPEANAG